MPDFNAIALKSPSPLIIVNQEKEYSAMIASQQR
jgi:hypothetical protein